jgi:hypothetical protein
MFGLLFDIAPAITELLKLKYEIQEKYFYELTQEQYEQLDFNNEEILLTWYMILPDNYNDQTIETLIVTENQMDNLLKAKLVVEQYAQKSDKIFENYQEKLEFTASMLPPIFSENTDFKKSHLKLVKKDNKTQEEEQVYSAEIASFQVSH